MKMGKSKSYLKFNTPKSIHRLSLSIDLCLPMNKKLKFLIKTSGFFYSQLNPTSLSLLKYQP